MPWKECNAISGVGPLQHFGYHFNKFTGTFGFRYLKWNLKKKTGLDNLSVIGPYVGAKWTF